MASRNSTASQSEILPEISAPRSPASRAISPRVRPAALRLPLALLIIYLVLAAQFESFRDPFIIILTVPLSVAGALLSLHSPDKR
jgi:multidrug efflux pump